MKSFVAWLCFSLVSASSAHAETVRVELASEGKARWPIVLHEQASPPLKESARTLALYLEKISGAKFEVRCGTGQEGIVLGWPEHFPDLKLPSFGYPKDPMKKEDYLLQTHPRGVWLIGASDLAVQHAVWDLLYRLGHRQFFPGKTWEVVPQQTNLALSVNVREHPAYLSRSIWYGYGTWDYNAEPYREWCVRNRMARSIDLHTGHAYDGIRRRNEAAFKEHPEYLGLWKDKRQSNHFCISNPGLRKLVVEDSLRQFEAKPDLQSISLEPADGASWCQCEHCRKIPVSDRALSLANEVAEALTKKFGDRFVGMYAYSEHSPPPSIQVHPKVIISVATAFVRGGFTVDQLMAGWQKQGATLGVREYYSVQTWDRDLPGAARGSNLAYLQRTIPHFHRLGARFLSAESSDNWGPNGLGYYLASRMLWDVKEADRTEALVDDFLDKAFGPAKETMRDFYRLLDGSKKSLLCDDLLGRLFRLLDQARKKTTDPAVQARLHDLVLYTRYVELFFEYSTAKGPDRQKAFEEVIKHGYRMRKTSMIHTKGLYRDLDNRDKSVSIPDQAKWNVPETKNPWKNSKPFADEELARFVSEGIAKHPLLDFQPVSFSRSLMPAKALKLPEVKEGSMGGYFRGLNRFWTWVEQPPAKITFQSKAGVIYTNQGPAKFQLYPLAEPEGKSVAQASTVPDREFHPVELPTQFPGLHQIEASGGGSFSLAVPGDWPITVESSPESQFHFHTRWSMYFYVPRGTPIVGGFASGPGSLLDANGKEALKFNTKPGYFSVKVPPGHDGKLWKFQNCAGVRYLMTVPPYLARSSQDLLLPREVVERDGK